MKIHSFEFNLFGVNTYLIWDELTLHTAVVDPGMSNPAECEEFSRFVSDNQLDIVRLIDTHLHIDHTMGNEYVEATYHVGLTAHRADAPLGKMRAAQARAFHLQGAHDTPVKINIEVNMGDKIYLGKQWLDVIEVPGHSPGSIALYSPEGGFVVTGDALFNGSIGRTDLAGGDHATLIRSIRSGLLTLPPDTMVYPGHGPSTTIAREINSNPFL